jgi:hypothetical protein
MDIDTDMDMGIDTEKLMDMDTVMDTGMDMDMNMEIDMDADMDMVTGFGLLNPYIHAALQSQCVMCVGESSHRICGQICPWP